MQSNMVIRCDMHMERNLGFFSSRQANRSTVLDFIDFTFGFFSRVLLINILCHEWSGKLECQTHSPSSLFRPEDPVMS